MRAISQLLLTFLLNAGWQIALITLAAALCAWLLRGMAARYRHLLWVIALASSFGLPLLTSSYLFDGKSSEQARAEVTTQERVMAILNRPKISLRRKNLLLAAAALVFIVPCVVAAPFALRININPQDAASAPSEAVVTPQEVVVKTRQGVTQAAREVEMKMREERRRQMREERLNQKAGAVRYELTRTKSKLVAEFQEAELAKLAQIPMHQAIQIATAQQPGTVLECRLRGRRVEDRELVMYDVRILSAEGPKSTVTRFAISAIDGRILGQEKR